MCVSNNKGPPYNLFGCEGFIVVAIYARDCVSAGSWQ